MSLQRSEKAIHNGWVNESDGHDGGRSAPD